MKPSIAVGGLEALQARLARLAAAPGLSAALRRSADTVRAEAKQRLAAGGRSGSALAASLEVIEEATGETPQFAIGSRLADTRQAEFGVRGRRASPFLLPALYAALPVIRQEIRNAVAAAAKSVALGRKSR